MPNRPVAGGTRLVYRPAVFGLARVHYSKSTAKIDVWETVAVHRQVRDPVPTDLWDGAETLTYDELELTGNPDDDEARFTPLASELTNRKNYTAWKTDLKNHLYRSQALVTYTCKALGEKSKPHESEGKFRVRLKQLASETRDLEVEKLRKKYAPKLKRLADRIQTAEQRIEREQAQVKEQGFKTAISLGTTVLGALFGRKLTSATNVTRVASSMRSAGRIASQKGDVDRAKESHESLLDEREKLDAEFEEATESLRESLDADSLEIEETPIRPRKSDLTVEQVALAWTPWIVDSAGIAEKAY